MEEHQALTDETHLYFQHMEISLAIIHPFQFSYLFFCQLYQFGSITLPFIVMSYVGNWHQWRTRQYYCAALCNPSLWLWKDQQFCLLFFSLASAWCQACLWQSKYLTDLFSHIIHTIKLKIYLWHLVTYHNYGKMYWKFSRSQLLENTLMLSISLGTSRFTPGCLFIIKVTEHLSWGLSTPKWKQ